MTTTTRRYVAFRNPATSNWVVLDREVGRAVVGQSVAGLGTYYRTRREAEEAARRLEAGATGPRMSACVDSWEDS